MVDKAFAHDHIVCYLLLVIGHDFAESAVIVLVPIWHSGLVVFRAFGLFAT